MTEILVNISQKSVPNLSSQEVFTFNNESECGGRSGGGGGGLFSCPVKEKQTCVTICRKGDNEEEDEEGMRHTQNITK